MARPSAHLASRRQHRRPRAAGRQWHGGAGLALRTGCAGSGQRGGIPHRRAGQPCRQRQLPYLARQRRHADRLGHPHQPRCRRQCYRHRSARHERQSRRQLRAGREHRCGRRVWLERRGRFRSGRSNQRGSLRWPLRWPGPCDRPSAHRSPRRRWRGPVRMGEWRTAWQCGSGQCRHGRPQLRRPAARAWPRGESDRQRLVVGPASSPTATPQPR